MGPQEVKVGDAARTRALFERCITLQLPAKKMKVRSLAAESCMLWYREVSS